MLILGYLNTYPNTGTFSEMVFGISNTKHFLHPKYNNKSFTPKHQLHHMSPMLQILTLGYRQSAWHKWANVISASAWFDALKHFVKYLKKYLNTHIAQSI